MATPSDFSVGLYHELTITGCNVGLEPKDISVLAKNKEKLRQVVAFIRGYAEIKPTTRIIDCNTDPLLNLFQNFSYYFSVVPWNFFAASQHH